MYSSKIYEPNQNILIADTEITTIADQTVKASACVILKLLPQPTIVIKWKGLPPDLIPLKNEFYLSFQNSIPILVQRKQVNVQISNGHKTNGILILAKSPSTIFDKKKHLQTIQFTILNFPFLFNKIRLEAEGWLVELTPMPNLKNSLEILKRDGGYTITHAGFVKKLDNSLFSVDDCKQLLRGLEWFLSFVRGTNCALTLVRGCDQCGEMSWEQWGLGAVDPWLYEDSWLPSVISNDILSKIFPGFWDQLKSNTWTNIARCLDWYSSSNTSNASHVRIVLNQASLEVLCSMICGSSGRFAFKLRRTLKKLNINTKIPSNCRELEKIRKNMEFEDSPHTLAEIRNDLVHSESKLGTVSSVAYWEALNLSRWYIEMILLCRFKYMDKYWNRLTCKTELVPWVKRASS